MKRVVPGGINANVKGIGAEEIAASSIKEAADLIIEKLKAEGFKILRYDAYSTSSIYLKVDYGVGHTIRISDHTGKKGLQYRYNVLKDWREVSTQRSPQGWPKHFYGFDRIGHLVQDIMQVRDKMQRYHGYAGYEKLMIDSLNENRRNPGFWSECREV